MENNPFYSRKDLETFFLNNSFFDYTIFDQMCQLGSKTNVSNGIFEILSGLSVLDSAPDNWCDCPLNFLHCFA